MIVTIKMISLLILIQKCSEIPPNKLPTTLYFLPEKYAEQYAMLELVQMKCLKCLIRIFVDVFGQPKMLQKITKIKFPLAILIFNNYTK